MRVLVTGGAGFIGSHLCDHLLGLGHEVMALDILVPQVHGGKGLRWGNGEPVPPWPSYMDPRVTSWICDVGNRMEVFRALQSYQPDVVIHLAAFVGVGQSWYEPSAYLYGGGVITAALFEAIAHHNAKTETKVRRVFVAGSMSCYGEGPVRDPSTGWMEDGRDTDAEALTGQNSIPVWEGYPLDPQNPYAMAKADGERIALMLGAHLGIEAVVGRFFNVVGERQALTNPYTGVGAIFSARLISGQAPMVFEDGQQSRDFIHVSDVVRAIWTIVEQAPAGEVYNVGTGTRTTILELAQRLCTIHGGGLEPLVTGISRAGDIRHCVADPSKLKALGWEPTVSLEQAVASLWAWVSQQALQDPDGFERAFGELLGHGLLRDAGGGVLQAPASPGSDPQAEDPTATPEQE